MEVKKQVGMLVNVMRPSEFTNWYLSKLGSCPPTETRRQVLTETSSKLFWQTGDFLGRNFRDA